MNRPVRSRMQGGVEAAEEKPAAVRFGLYLEIILILFTHFHAVAVIAGFYNIAIMADPIKQGCGSG